MTRNTPQCIARVRGGRNVGRRCKKAAVNGELCRWHWKYHDAADLCSGSDRNYEGLEGIARLFPPEPH